MSSGVRFSEEDLAAWKSRGVRVHESRTPAKIEAADVGVPRASSAVPIPDAGGGVDKPPAQIKRPEQALQLQVAEFLDWALPDAVRWLHIPNENGTRDAWEGKLLKALGVKAGAADVLVFWAGRFAWIELKSATGSLSRAQRDWRDYCEATGAPWFLCRSLDDVIAALESLQIRLRARA